MREEFLLIRKKKKKKKSNDRRSKFMINGSAMSSKRLFGSNEIQIEPSRKRATMEQAEVTAPVLGHICACSNTAARLPADDYAAFTGPSNLWPVTSDRWSVLTGPPVGLDDTSIEYIDTGMLFV